MVESQIAIASMLSADLNLAVWYEITTRLYVRKKVGGLKSDCQTAKFNFNSSYTAFYLHVYVAGTIEGFLINRGILISGYVT